MPKEVIHSDDGLRALVKWRKDDEHPEFPNTPGHVQIATINPAIDDPDQTGAAGFYVDLDADQIDYLIAVLRKARRQAFPEHHSAHAGGFSSSAEPKYGVVYSPTEVAQAVVNHSIGWLGRRQ